MTPMSVHAKTLLLLALLSAWRTAPALTRYEPDSDTIWVYDYPRRLPCTPARLLAADRMFEWNRIAYDATTDTYTVNANLRVGNADGSDTFFQLGSPAQPRETLRMKGNLILFPETITGQMRRGPKGVNRITIGVPDNPDVRAALLFHNAPTQHHTLLSGGFVQGPDTASRVAAYGGQFCVYHGTVSAAVPDRPHAIGAAGGRHLYLPGAWGGLVVLRQATVSWVAGVIGFGLDARASDLDGTVFEDSGYGLINGRQAATNCVFRRLGVAVKDWGGPLDVLLTDCVFEDNGANWSLSRGRLRCVDCAFGAPRQGNRYDSWPEQRAGKTPYAYMQSSRHLVVEVREADGKPVPRARVEATTPSDPLARLVALTDAQGRTPGRGSDRALLLTERVETATAVTNQPAITPYRWRLSISATNYAPAVIQDLAPDTSWRVIPVTLNRKQR